jgi:hypothetical protein
MAAESGDMYHVDPPAPIEAYAIDPPFFEE